MINSSENACFSIIFFVFRIGPGIIGASFRSCWWQNSGHTIWIFPKENFRCFREGHRALRTRLYNGAFGPCHYEDSHEIQFGFGFENCRLRELNWKNLHHLSWCRSCFLNKQKWKLRTKIEYKKKLKNIHIMNFCSTCHRAQSSLRCGISIQILSVTLFFFFLILSSKNSTISRILWSVRHIWFFTFFFLEKK